MSRGNPSRQQVCHPPLLGKGLFAKLASAPGRKHRLYLFGMPSANRGGFSLSYPRSTSLPHWRQNASARRCPPVFQAPARPTTASGGPALHAARGTQPATAHRPPSPRERPLDNALPHTPATPHCYHNQHGQNPHGQPHPEVLEQVHQKVAEQAVHDHCNQRMA